MMGSLILFVLIGAKLQMDAFYWCIYGAMVICVIGQVIIKAVTEDG